MGSRPIACPRKSTERHHQGRWGNLVFCLSGQEQAGESHLSLRKPGLAITSSSLARQIPSCSFSKTPSRPLAFHTENNGLGPFMTRGLLQFDNYKPLVGPSIFILSFSFFLCVSVVYMYVCACSQVSTEACGGQIRLSGVFLDHRRQGLFLDQAC